ncbi:MAG: hypothetical protein AB8B61_05760 [Cyclobacteriaceae bacterium]
MNDNLLTPLIAILGLVANEVLTSWLGLAVGVFSVLWLIFQLVRGIIELSWKIRDRKNK